MFWYYVLRVDVFITVVTFQNVDYTCTQTVVLHIMVLLELTSIHIIEYRSMGDSMGDRQSTAMLQSDLVVIVNLL